MDEVLARVWNDLVARTQGPMCLRLVIQPLVAVFFGVRAGLRNARRSPDALDDHRRDNLRQAWTDLGTVVLVALVLDVIVQLIVLRTVYPGETLFVVFLIVVVPYQIIRTVVARVFRKHQPPGKA